MPALRELQERFVGALLSGEVLDELIVGDGLAVHRNNVFASLSDMLAAEFPVVRRLVGEGFFAYAAHEFIQADLPTRPCLSDYGAGFADFLASFPPVASLPYLADVARLERLMQVAAQVRDGEPLSPAAIAATPPEHVAEMRFSFQPSVGYLASPWPIAAIWRANQDQGDGAVDLDAGGENLEVRRRDGVIEMRRLPDDAFAFRAALAAGESLAEAACGDVAAEFPALFTEGLLEGIL